MSETTIEVRLATDPAEVAAGQAVRSTVFVGEQQVDPSIEQDGRDPEAVHLVALVDGAVVGAARVLIEDASRGPLAGRTAERVAHLGRIAVLAIWRGRGIGSALVRAAEAASVDAGVDTVYLGSQVHALGFYEALGYQSIGARYLEAGIDHQHLAKALITSAAATVGARARQWSE